MMNELSNLREVNMPFSGFCIHRCKRLWSREFNWAVRGVIRFTRLCSTVCPTCNKTHALQHTIQHNVLSTYPQTKLINEHIIFAVTCQSLLRPLIWISAILKCSTVLILQSKWHNASEEAKTASHTSLNFPLYHTQNLQQTQLTRISHKQPKLSMHIIWVLPRRSTTTVITWTKRVEWDPNLRFSHI